MLSWWAGGEDWLPVLGKARQTHRYSSSLLSSSCQTYKLDWSSTTLEQSDTDNSEIDSCLLLEFNDIGRTLDYRGTLLEL